MKITINVEPSAAETSLLVTCKELTPQIEKLLAAIRILDKQITANKGDAVCLINLADVFYIEALERKTFIYTDKEVFDSEMKLYELEAALAQYNFVRVSKNTICSLSKIKTLKSEVDRKRKSVNESMGFKISYRFVQFSFWRL